LGLPLLFLPSSDQVNIHLGHLLSPMHNTCLYNFNMLFCILSTIICVTFPKSSTHSIRKGCS
jgi:hypothetical protein